MKEQPKYRTIIDDVIISISTGKINLGDILPSLIDICKTYEVSRDTAVKAYQELKTRGIIGAMPGKGYYVESTDVNSYRKVFLFFDELSPYKSILYNSIIQNMDKSIGLDVYFHHFNNSIFSKLLAENMGKYTDYVIMPIANADFELLERLSKTGKVYFLDQGLHYNNNSFPCVCQDFKNDLFNFFKANMKSFKQYRKLIMQIDKPKHESEQYIVNQFIDGFESFCKEAEINYSIKEEIEMVENDVCYLVHNDLQLVALIKKCTEKNLLIGIDLGIISYNEHPLKEVVNMGISTISTDFYLMGKTIAEMIENNCKDRVINRFTLNERKSFETV